MAYDHNIEWKGAIQDSRVRHANNHLPKVLTTGQILERFNCLLKGKNFADVWFELVSLDESEHFFERLLRPYTNPTTIQRPKSGIFV